jgi:hypothetical protein
MAWASGFDFERDLVEAVRIGEAGTSVNDFCE